jgi:hypothetical protein
MGSFDILIGMALGVGLWGVLGGNLMRKVVLLRIVGLGLGMKWVRLRVYRLELLPID